MASSRENSPKSLKSNTPDEGDDLFGHVSDSDEEKSIQKSVSQRSRSSSRSSDDVGAKKRVKKQQIASSDEEDPFFGSKGVISSSDESSTKKRRKIKRRSSSGSKSPSESDREAESDKQSEVIGDVSEEEPTRENRRSPMPKEQKVESIRLPDLRAPATSTDPFYLGKLPTFLAVEEDPFDRRHYRPADSDKFLLQTENTIRWRNTAKDNMELESNARLIRWSDNSMSLMVGGELFQVPVQSWLHTNQYLVLQQKQSGIYQTQARFAESINFQVAGTGSKTHRKLTAAIAETHRKGTRLQMIYVDKDPEKQKLEAERSAADKLRLERKQRGVRRKRRGVEEELEDSDDDYPRERQRPDEYEVDDGFIVDDTRIKESKRGRHQRDESDDESEAESSEEESEEEKPRKKLRRIVSSEDE